MNQKEISKQYQYMNGKFIDVFIGRVPCKMKQIEKELSVYQKENEYGLYEPITIKISKTNYNGKFLIITPYNFFCGATLRIFKLQQEDINDMIHKINMEKNYD